MGVLRQHSPEETDEESICYAQRCSVRATVKIEPVFQSLRTQQNKLFKDITITKAKNLRKREGLLEENSLARASLSAIKLLRRMPARTSV